MYKPTVMIDLVQSGLWAEGGRGGVGGGGGGGEGENTLDTQRMTTDLDNVDTNFLNEEVQY